MSAALPPNRSGGTSEPPPDPDMLLCRDLLYVAHQVAARVRLGPHDGQEFAREFLAQTLGAARLCLAEERYAPAWAARCAQHFACHFGQAQNERRKHEALSCDLTTQTPADPDHLLDGARAPDPQTRACAEEFWRLVEQVDIL